MDGAMLAESRIDNDQSDNSYIDVYSEFLQGKRTARLTEKDEAQGMEEMTLWDCGYRDDTYSNFSYALFDMNGDSIPELHVRGAVLYAIFTYYDNELLLWHSTSLYRVPTDDGALLFYRLGGAPPHLKYGYEVLDFWGNVQLSIEFIKGDIDMNDIYDERDDYFFCGVEVTKEQWDALTERYLSATSNKIEWIRLTEDFTGIQ